MQETLEILKVLKDYNVRLSIEGEQVRLLNIPENFPNEILEWIKSKKSELINFHKESTYGNKTSIIPKTPELDNYALSGSQKRLWLLSQFEGGSIAYNTPFCFKLKGLLNLEALKRAILELTIRHESLRTIFIEVEGEPRQQILSELKETDVFNLIDLSNLSTDSKSLEDILKIESERAFDLTTGPLLRVTIFQLSETENILFFNLHHIISDGWSMNVILKDLLLLYDAFIKGYANPLPPLRIQYKDYSAWQTEQNTVDTLKLQKDYWKSKFEGEIPVLDFPTDRPRPKVQSYKGDQITFEINEELTEQIKTFCKQADVTLFMALLAFVKTLLYRYTSQNDIVVGVPVAGREHAGLEDQVGFYVNTLALRTSFEENVSFQELLANVKEVTLGAYEHQGYGFDQLIEELDIPRDFSRNPLFDVMVVLQNTDKQADKLPSLNNLELERYVSGHVVSKFDVTFNFVEQSGKINCDIEYSTDLFDEARIQRLFGHMSKIIETTTISPVTKINNLDILTEIERYELIYDFNNTQFEYSKQKTIIDFFEESVAQNPNKIALIYEDLNLTYFELHEKVLSLASDIKDFGIGRENLVAIIADRSIEMIISILSVLKAGGAYLPIDIKLPADRIHYMLINSKVNLIISNVTGGFKKFRANNYIDLNNYKFQKVSNRIDNINEPTDLAYVIYTSGSTGNPKGVEIEHAGIVNMVLDQIRRFNIQTNDTLLQFASFSFDASIYELLLTMFSGATLCLISDCLISNKIEFIEFIRNKKVTIATLPPSYVAMFTPEDLASLRVLITAGEEANAANANKLKGYLKYINAYGPTEFSVCATTYELREKDEHKLKIPIGRPINNCKVFILDKYHQLVPKGIKGNLYLSGMGIARGYINNQELTDEKFIDHLLYSNQKMYNTGDLASWNQEGEIEFFGRNDKQIKLRGFRIELGEIESCIKRIPGIEEVVVITKGTSSENKRIICFYKASEKITKQIIHSNLSSKLPTYMIPDVFVPIEKFSKTISGKIDGKNLPIPEIELKREYIGPRNETERNLTAVWSEVLGIEIEKISIDDNFFELGGHSLKVTKVIYKIQETFGKKIQLKEIFNFPTLEEQASLIEQQEVSQQVVIQNLAEQEHYAVSGAQKRFWVLSQLEGGSVAYNISFTLVLDGELVLEPFKEAIQKLIERHESLRTVFLEVDGELRQKIMPFTSFSGILTVVDLKSEQTNEDKIDTLIKSEVHTLLDLTEGPLIKLTLIQLSPIKNILIFNLHHIISDGWSIDIIINDLLKTYNACIYGNDIPLEPLSIQYKDYVAWFNGQFERGLFENHKQYWKKQFDGEIPVMNFPTDKPRSNYKNYNGNKFIFELDNLVTKELKEFCKKQNVTLFMSFLAFLNTLLYKYTNQKDIIIGVPAAGREHGSLRNIVGLFINTLALRTKFENNSSFLDVLMDIKETTIKGQEHQVYEFDKIIEDIDIKHEANRNPLFDIMMVYQNSEINNCSLIKVDNLKISPYETEHFISKFDIKFTFTEVEDRIRCSIEYNTDLFYENRFKRLEGHLLNIIQQTTQRPEIKISEIEILTDNESNELSIRENRIQYYPIKTVKQLFVESATKHAKNISLVDSNGKLTYAELHSKTVKIATFLNQRNIGSNDVVAIVGDRSITMVVGILGIIESGAAYLPIEADNPTQRIMNFLDNSEAKLVLCCNEDTKKQIRNKNVFIIDELIESVDLSSSLTHSISDAGDMDPFYLIYTSGSTGKPKGVVINNQQIINYLSGIQENILTDEIKSYAHLTTFSSDLGNTMLFLSILKGSTLYIPMNETVLNTGKFIEFITDNKIDCYKTVPTLISNLLIDSDKRIFPKKLMILGGELFSLKLLDDIKNLNPTCEIYNHYGPTEACIGITTHHVDLNKEYFFSVPIGKPLSNTMCHILDKDLKRVPIGVYGELYVSGLSVGSGYYKDAETTEDKFVKVPNISDRIFYTTGDIVRHNEDGNLEFLKRTDSQVKVDGHRIDTKEIEVNLKEIVFIQDVKVAPFQYMDKTVIVAFVILALEKLESKADACDNMAIIEEIKGYLSKSLPLHMIPKKYIILDKLPITTNGKLDSRKLKRYFDDSYNQIIVPRDELEIKIASIWSSVLTVEQNIIGVNSDFFELGGNSLLAMRLAIQLSSEFNIRISLKDVFKQSFLFMQAQTVIMALDKGAIEILKSKKIKDYKLSPQQRGIFFSHFLDPSNTHYNTPVVFKIAGEIDINKTKKSLKEVVIKHDILRSYYEIKNNEPVLNIHPDVEVEVINYKIASSNYKSEINCFIRPFRLNKPPLIRVGILDTEKTHSYMIIDVHHIICDLKSHYILFQDFIKSYNGIPIKDSSLQYMDYAEWISSSDNQIFSQDSKVFWLEKMAILPSKINFNFEVNKSKNDFDGDIFDLKIGESCHNAIDRFTVKLKVTKFDFFLGVWNIVLSKISGSEDIIVAVPIENRPTSELQALIGMFVNTLPIRNNPNASLTLSDFMHTVHENNLECFEHQSYPIDAIIKDLRTIHNSAFKSFLSVALSYQDKNSYKYLELKNDYGFENITFDTILPKSKFDLTLRVEEEPNTYNCSLLYSKAVFNPSDIEKILSYFNNVLNQILDNIDLQIEMIEPFSQKFSKR